MLVLAIGDLHIPERVTGLPAKFKRLLQPRGKIQQVLCVGNVTNSPSYMEYLKSLSPDFQMVKGDHDEDLSIPLSLVFKYDKLKVGLIGGFEVVPKSDPLSLLAQARMMDVDILIYGSSHKVEAYTLDGKFFINPGSATGAFSTETIDKDDMDIIKAILSEGNEEQAKEEPKEINKEITKENDKIDADENETESKNDQKETLNTKGKDDKPEVDVKEKDDNPDGKSISTAETSTQSEPDKSSPNQADKKSIYDDDDDLDTSKMDSYLDPIPSFCLLDLQGSSCILYLYTLIDGEVKVDKLTYKKDETA